MKVFLLTCVSLLAVINYANACSCGLEGSASRIFKGSKAKAHKYPWMANIKTYKASSSEEFGLCGGSLVDEKHIATAAHCVYIVDKPVDASLIRVFLGEVKAKTEKTEPLNVTSYWAHPKYNYSNLENDIAILTLSKAVNFTQKIAPVCIPTQEDGLSKLTVAGWGLQGAEDTSDDLMETQVDFIPKKECNEIKLNHILTQAGYDPATMKPEVRARITYPAVRDSHMCAINKETMGDACGGDSGGPLTHKSADGLHYLMGIVSGAWANCGTTKYMAGLYTRTVAFLDDIKAKAPNACFKQLV